jgi:hypothetical protein
MSKSDIVAALQKDADVAAEYSRQIGNLLDAVKAVDGRLEGLPSGFLGMGTVGFFATIHARLKHGIGSGKPPDPSFTKERFLFECESIFNALDNYYGVVAKEAENEANRRSGGA